MPSRGGATDKFGNRYEGKWTVSCMLDVLEGKASSICIEALEITEAGFEFRIERDGTWAHHQVKRQTGEGKWSLAHLRRLGILTNFWRILNLAPADTCVFVSTALAHELDELSDRARNAGTWENFRDHVLNVQLQADAFVILCEAWGISASTHGTADASVSTDPRRLAYDALLRTVVWPIGERPLEAVVDGRLEALVDGLTPATARAVLADLALDQLHHELTAPAIWRHLEKRGARRRRWGDDPSVLASVADQTELYRASVEARLPSFGYLARPETERVLQLLADPDATRWAIVTSEAGGGKSALLADILRRADELEWPMLAFRMDVLNATPSPRALGRDQLDLPGSPPMVLRSVAAGRPCLLVIDQLDAVGSASGRNPAFFACVENMLLQVRGIPNMRVVLACRTFDLESSPELRRLVAPQGPATPVVLEPLSADAIRDTVLSLGLDASRLNERQTRLLQIPLHLSLLADVAGDAERDPLVFGTSNDLFAHYWEIKDRAVSERLDGRASWTTGIDALLADMSANHRLFTPETALDAVSRDARALASEHVVVHERKQYRFFHEAFFDYAFARRFLARGHRLVDFLRTEGQDLFRRAQVRQVLWHERSEDTQRYLEDARQLLTAPNIRFHIRALVLDVLGLVDDPTREEWDIVQAILDGPNDDLARRALGIILGGAAWRGLIDRFGVCAMWLDSPDPRHQDYATRLLSVMQATTPDRVAELLQPHLGQVGRVDQVRAILWATDAPGGARLQTFMARCLEAGVFEDDAARTVGQALAIHVAEALAEADPAWVSEFLGAFLTRAFERASARGEEGAEVIEAHFGVASDRTRRLVPTFFACAKGAPRAFAAHLLPCMHRVVTANLYGDPVSPDGPRRDHVWGRRHRDVEHIFTAQDALLASIEVAFQRLGQGGREDCDALDRTIAELRTQRWADSETGCYLLLRAYAAAGPRLAEDAAMYLIEHPAALSAGYSDNPEWAAHEVLVMATGSCSADALARLEDTILAYFPPYERRKSGRQWWGSAQFVLLGGIDPARMSDVARRKLGEWRRKFGRDDATPPQPAARGGFVESPIPPTATPKMTDEQWLRALARYPDDEDIATRWRPDGRLAGGALQLANELRGAAQRQPSRFAALALRIPLDANPAYVSALLAGLENAELDEPQVLALCRRIHQIPGRPCGRELSRFIAKHCKTVLAADALGGLLEIVTWYATESPDPPPGDGKSDAKDVYVSGLNSIRGAAAEVLAELVEGDPMRLPLLDAQDPALVDRLMRDPSVAVRTCAAGVGASVALVDPDRAVALFSALTDCDDAVFASLHVDAFLRRLLRSRPESIDTALARMRASQYAEVALHGAMHTSVLGLLDERWAAEAEACVRGRKELRLGAAHVYAINVTNASCRAVSADALARLFDDEDPEVRAAASHCFEEIGASEVGQFAGTIRAFLRSAALEEHVGVLFATLRRSTEELAELTCEACERYLARAGDTVADIRTSAASHADSVAELIVRSYDLASRHTDLRERCLDVVDTLLRYRTNSVGRVLAQYER